MGNSKYSTYINAQNIILICSQEINIKTNTKRFFLVKILYLSNLPSFLFKRQKNSFQQQSLNPLSFEKLNNN